jgi:hypothetical protein
MDLPITKKVHAEKRKPSPVCETCMKPIASCGCAMRGNKKIQRSNSVVAK